MVKVGEAIVLSGVGGRYRVYDNGETLDATIRGRIKQASSQKILVGDRVVLHRHPDGTSTIEEISPRRSLLRRRSPGKSSGVRPIAANLDQVIVVGAAARPDWDPHMIDRFIAVAEASELVPVVVMNKIDLAPDVAGELEMYRDAGYATLTTSVPAAQGLETLRSQLAGRVSLFTGPSGVGKSSLLNSLEPGLKLRTGQVSERAGSGRLGATPEKVVPDEEILQRLLYPLLNEAAMALEEGVVRNPRDGDIAAVFGFGFPPFRGGPLRYTDTITAQAVVEGLRRLEQVHGKRFSPTERLVRMAAADTRFYQGP